MKMEGAPIGDYMDNSTGLNYLSTIASSTLLNSMEPVSVHQKSYEESIQVKELLLDALQGREIIPIDNKEYKNEEIDKIVTKIETFSTEFHLLQKELDGLHDQYNKEVVKTTDNIRKIESSIQLMKKMEDEYQTDDMVKAIVDNLNDYSKKIQDFPIHSIHSAKSLQTTSIAGFELKPFVDQHWADKRSQCNFVALKR